MTQGPDPRESERELSALINDPDSTERTDDSDRGWGDERSAADREADDDERLTREKPPHW